MAASSVEKSQGTTPPPTPEELSSILELQLEHMQLLEERKRHLGLFNALYSELEWALIIEGQIRAEIETLRAELLSLGTTLDFEPSKEQESEHALSEESAKTIEKFIVYLLNRVQSASAEGVNDTDLPPNFLSLACLSNPQPHQGAEALGLKTPITGCGCCLMAPSEQPTALTSEVGVTVASWGAGTPGTPSTITMCHTSQCSGHHVPAQPMVANNPQSLEPHAIAMPIRKHLPRPVSTLPVFPEVPPKLTLSTGGVPLQRISQTTVPSDTLMQHDDAQSTSAYECMVLGNFSQNREAIDLRYLEIDRCKVAEAGNSLLPTDLQQAMSSNPSSCPSRCVASGSPPPASGEHGSECSAPMMESNSMSGEHLPTSWSDQPNHVTVELSSSASSTGVVSMPIPHGITTVVVRNVPARYTKELLLQEWPPNGTYDFIYLPYNFKQKRPAGFVYVNFVSHEAALNFYSQWHGKSLCNKGSVKRLSIGVAEAQGLEANLRHVAASKISRIKNSKHMPSVFNGVEEVPLAELLDQISGDW